MQNVYESVDANKQKSWLVIGFFITFVTVSALLIAKGLAYYYGYESTGLEITGLALVLSGLTSFASYYFSDSIVLTLSSAKPANRKDHFTFYTVSENLSLAAGLPMPKLYVIEDTALNAFATGRDPKHAAVCATSGLLATLNRTELEGVVGHELSHIANYDTRLMSLVTVMVGVITLLGDWLLRANWYSSGNRENRSKSGGAVFMLVGLILAILSPIIAQLIQLAISRRREYLADASSVKLTRQPGGLISALTKLGQDREPLEAANKATAHLYIVNPLKNHHDLIGLFSGLFNTHPPLSDRIKTLQQMQ
ncbi:zinc metalloprotease HtpX [Candidatus Amesbacteria bacterium RIFOXYB1_FULL_44_23]|uniref:Protease HtpX homolog n=1 Tax=Candidatus Amesbacteria bacterium RIFOXYB1_FULL_44_23 TaxID=1797263 RepID=A0A1F4ZX45_9BACT|nr:MAG: zinc metalloprotease HtpX [Candidatus Amesbacteria bacterium RIFOXYB1_FULL_44_23]